MFFLFSFPMILFFVVVLILWWKITVRISNDNAIKEFLDPIRRANEIANQGIEMYKKTIPSLIAYLDARGADITGNELVEFVKKLTTPNMKIAISLSCAEDTDEMSVLKEIKKFLSDSEDTDDMLYLTDNKHEIEKFLSKFDSCSKSYKIREICALRSDIPTHPIKIYPNVKVEKMWTETNENYMIRQISSVTDDLMVKTALVAVAVSFFIDLANKSESWLVTILFIPFLLVALSQWVISETRDRVAPHKCRHCGAVYSRRVTNEWIENESQDYHQEKTYDEYGNLKDVNFMKRVEFDEHEDITCLNCGWVSHRATHHSYDEER